MWRCVDCSPFCLVSGFFLSSALGSPRIVKDFPGGASGKEPVSQYRRCKRHEFDPWVGKIPWRRAWQPTPVFLPGKSHGQRKLGRLQSIGSQKVRHDQSLTHAQSLWEIINTFTEDNIYDFSSKSYLLASVNDRPRIFSPGKQWRAGSLPVLKKIKWIAFQIDNLILFHNQVFN